MTQQSVTWIVLPFSCGWITSYLSFLLCSVYVLQAKTFKFLCHLLIGVLFILKFKYIFPKHWLNIFQNLKNWLEWGHNQFVGNTDELSYLSSHLHLKWPALMNHSDFLNRNPPLQMCDDGMYFSYDGNHLITLKQSHVFVSSHDQNIGHMTCWDTWPTELAIMPTVMVKGWSIL